MAGEISQGLLARVRSRINEPSAGEWADSEIYANLSRGQTDLVTNQLCDGALTGLREIVEGTLVGAQNPYDLPADFLRARVVYYKGIWARRWEKRYIAALGEGTATANVHVSPSETNPYYYIHADQIVFAVGAVTQTNGDKYELFYVKSPTDVTTSVDPLLPAYLHGLMVDFAVSRCREQAHDFGEAEAVMRYYLEMASRVNARYRGSMAYDGPGGDPSVTFTPAGG